MGNSNSQSSGKKRGKLRPDLSNKEQNMEEFEEAHAIRQPLASGLGVVSSESENSSNPWVLVEHGSESSEFECEEKFVEDEEFEKDPHEPFHPLTDKEEGEVFRILQSGKDYEILVVHEPSGIEIGTKEIKCLSSGADLNDEVINLYLELLKEREKREPERFLKCHFFNTFFYKKLTNGRTGYDFKAVRRWTSHKKLGYYLIDCDKIFFPICRDVHWCLAAVDIRRKTFQYLDSLGSMDTHVLSILARYLTDEVKDKTGQEMDFVSWKLESVDNLPQQKNWSDCGVFMLKYCDFYSRGLNLYFAQEHMEYFRKRTAMEILNLRAE